MNLSKRVKRLIIINFIIIIVLVIIGFSISINGKDNGLFKDNLAWFGVFLPSLLAGIYFGSIGYSVIVKDDGWFSEIFIWCTGLAFGFILGSGEGLAVGLIGSSSYMFCATLLIGVAYLFKKHFRAEITEA
ncbi:MAG: hypothetical protein PHS07_03820 [Patescibacteria group bacterium]|jgi:hypothetical protein|nr:hypothetical protein [Patescibacteria group bacterium]